MDNNLFTVFVFLAAACLVVPLASRFKLGSVLGYLAAGIIIGLFGLSLIGDAEKIMHFAEFGVVMILFLIGLEVGARLALAFAQIDSWAGRFAGGTDKYGIHAGRPGAFAFFHGTGFTNAAGIQPDEYSR